MTCRCSRCSASGALSAVGTPRSFGSHPSSLAFDPTGGRLAVTLSSDNAFALATISPDGAFGSAASSTQGGLSDPGSGSFSPDGHLYATVNRGGSSVAVYAGVSRGGTDAGRRLAVPDRREPDRAGVQPGRQPACDREQLGRHDLRVLGLLRGHAEGGRGCEAHHRQRPLLDRVQPRRRAAREHQRLGRHGLALRVRRPRRRDRLRRATTSGTRSAQSVPTRFSCAGSVFSPSVSACTDSHGGAGATGQLDTSAIGSWAYSVTATTADGQTATRTIRYTVGPHTYTEVAGSPSRRDQPARGRVQPARRDRRDGQCR